MFFEIAQQIYYTYFRWTTLLHKWWCIPDKRWPCLVHPRLEWWVQSWIWRDCQQGVAWIMEELVSFDYRGKWWSGRSHSCSFLASQQILPHLLQCRWRMQKLQLWVEQRVSHGNISTQKLQWGSCLQHQSQWRNLPWKSKHSTTSVQRCQALFEWSLVWDLCTFWKTFKPQDLCGFDFTK